MTKTRTIFIFGILAIVVFLARSLYTVPPGFHDARKKWIVAGEMAETHDLKALVSWDHHSSRWGVVIPAAVAIELNGKNLVSYLVLVLSLFTAIYLILLKNYVRECGPAVAFLFAVLLFYEPMFFRASSQLQPFVFGVLSILLALWAVCRYIDSNKLWYLGIAAFFAFWSYGSKELYLFFVPGLLLLLYLKSGLRSCIWFCSGMLGLLLVETLVFNAIHKDLILGRVEFLGTGKHVARMSGDIPFSSDTRKITNYYNSLDRTGKLIEYLFGRWFRLPVFDQVLVVASTIAGIYLFVSSKLKQVSSFSLGIILLTISYSFFVSVTPLSIRPLIPIQPAWEKYLTPVMPFFLYILLLVVGVGVNGLQIGRKKMAVYTLNSLAAVFLLFAWFVGSPFTYNYKGQDYPDKDAMLWEYKKLNNALLAGQGICARKTKQLLLPRAYIKEYASEDGFYDRLEIRSVDNLPMMYLGTVDPASVSEFIAYNDYDVMLDREGCKARFSLK